MTISYRIDAHDVLIFWLLIYRKWEKLRCEKYYKGVIKEHLKGGLGGSAILLPA